MLLENCFAAVCLTEKAAKIMNEWKILGLKEKTSVIPCCADLDKFTFQKGKDWRVELGIPKEAKILVYSGSLGTWYLLEEMLRFFRRLIAHEPDFYFCFFTPDAAAPILAQAKSLGIPEEKIKIRSLRHEEMPGALSSADLAICFIRPSFSKQSSSPTKIGEYLGIGLPVIANAGVGDTDAYFTEHPIGALASDLSDAGLDAIAKNAKQLMQLPKTRIREAAEKLFSLNNGVKSYAAIYESGEKTVRT
jgi:glycosyltransferase involved in cell wall biosynthesis